MRKLRWKAEVDFDEAFTGCQPHHPDLQGILISDLQGFKRR
jgi:hypothetical protein